LRSITAKTFRSSAKFHRLCAAARCLVPLFRGQEVLSSPGLYVRVVKRSSDLTVTLVSHCPLMALIGHSDCAPNCLLLAQCGHSNHVHECPHLGNSGHWLAHSRFLYMNRQKREQAGQFKLLRNRVGKSGDYLCLTSPLFTHVQWRAL